MDKMGICLKCGNPNRCAIVQGIEGNSCWCHTISLTQTQLDELKKHAFHSSCLCESCLKGFIGLFQLIDKPEWFDGRNRKGEIIGPDLKRGQPIPKGLYHAVVEIYAINHFNQILVTQRDKRKPFGLKWEITGGSVLKGESILEGAIRELFEETGLVANESDLTLAYIHRKHPVCTHAFVYQKPFDHHSITLQPGETVDFKLLKPHDFNELVASDDYAEPLAKRWKRHGKQVQALMNREE